MLEEAWRVWLGPHMEPFSDASLQSTFFAPLQAALDGARNTRACESYDDDTFLRLGAARVLSDLRTGRGFLQQFVAALAEGPKRSNFFEALKSERRLSLVEEVSAKVAATVPDRGAFPAELSSYQVYAGDGHWHAAASHEAPIDGQLWAAGHLYALNLRTRALQHLDMAEGKKEHDLHALKRLGAQALKMGAKKGQKCLWIWDRACLDYELWRQWKHSSGIYFISRTKENRAFDRQSIRPFDLHDPINRGIFSDQTVLTESGVELRMVQYISPTDGCLYEFITSAFDLPPGLIAWLYHRRWDIEKVFDQFKNKLVESKAWGASATAKRIQAKLLCLTHNLLELFEDRLNLDHNIRNDAELARQKSRLAQQLSAIADRKLSLSSLYTRFIQPLQRSLKLLRWLRAHWNSSAPLTTLLPHLRHLYAQL